MRFECKVFARLVVVYSKCHVTERGYLTRISCKEESGRDCRKTCFDQVSLAFDTKTGIARGVYCQRALQTETKPLSWARSFFVPGVGAGIRWANAAMRWLGPIFVIFGRDSGWLLLGPPRP